MSASVTSSRGGLLAAILNRSWIVSPPSALSISSAQLEEVTHLLYGCGAAALGWWRVRETELQDSPSAELLHQAFRLQALYARIQQTKIQKIFRLLRGANVEPILIKGWAIARFYPHQGLRPSGDIDLFVKASDYSAAERVIETEDARDCWVDLHQRLFELRDRRAEDLFSRSELTECGEVQIRTLCAEDHFALLAVHFLKHGAWRPLWLCDIGLLLETMPSDFDWDLCLGKSKRHANWILSAVGLAQALVGAKTNNEAIAARARQIPAWLGRAVLKQWENPFNFVHESHPLMARYLSRPIDFIREIPKRWPDPIVATVNLKGQFNSFPRLAYQLAEMAARSAKFLWRLPHHSQRQT